MGPTWYSILSHKLEVLCSVSYWLWGLEPKSALTRLDHLCILLHYIGWWFAIDSPKLYPLLGNYHKVKSLVTAMAYETLLATILPIQGHSIYNAHTQAICLLWICLQLQPLNLWPLIYTQTIALSFPKWKFFMYWPFWSCLSTVGFNLLPSCRPFVCVPSHRLSDLTCISPKSPPLSSS